jgi:hypothetical protein
LRLTSKMSSMSSRAVRTIYPGGLFVSGEIWKDTISNNGIGDRKDRHRYWKGEWKILATLASLPESLLPSLQKVSRARWLWAGPEWRPLFNRGKRTGNGPFFLFGMVIGVLWRVTFNIDVQQRKWMESLPILNHLHPQRNVREISFGFNKYLSRLFLVFFLTAANVIPTSGVCD